MTTQHTEPRHFLMNVEGGATHLVNLDTNEICLNYVDDSSPFHSLLSITDCAVGKNAKLIYMDNGRNIQKAETGLIKKVRILQGKFLSEATAEPRD